MQKKNRINIKCRKNFGDSDFSSARDIMNILFLSFITELKINYLYYLSYYNVLAILQLTNEIVERSFSFLIDKNNQTLVVLSRITEFASPQYLYFTFGNISLLCVTQVRISLLTEV